MQANMEMMKKQEKSLQEEQKLYDLKSRLKARQKISQLQSEKMKEILNIKSLLELQLQDCTEQIQSIKMNTDKKLDIV
jgi:succinate dehydrogenase/fumarate reductase flavoprotein subunit